MLCYSSLSSFVVNIRKMLSILCAPFQIQTFLNTVNTECECTFNSHGLAKTSFSRNRKKLNGSHVERLYRISTIINSHILLTLFHSLFLLRGITSEILMGRIKVCADVETVFSVVDLLSWYVPCSCRRARPRVESCLASCLLARMIMKKKVRSENGSLHSPNSCSPGVVVQNHRRRVVWCIFQSHRGCFPSQVEDGCIVLSVSASITLVQLTASLRNGSYSILCDLRVEYEVMHVLYFSMWTSYGVAIPTQFFRCEQLGFWFGTDVGISLSKNVTW